MVFLAARKIYGVLSKQENIMWFCKQQKKKCFKQQGKYDVVF